MWLCLNDGFLSVVADRNDGSRLLVRARRLRDLINIVGNDVEVLENAGSDYRWRTFVDRKAFSTMMAARIEAIGYTNFKNSAKDHELHDLYMEFWGVHKRYQDKARSGRRQPDRSDHLAWGPGELEHNPKSPKRKRK
jgi:hypothetical protein